MAQPASCVSSRTFFNRSGFIFCCFVLYILLWNRSYILSSLVWECMEWKSVLTHTRNGTVNSGMNQIIDTKCRLSYTTWQEILNLAPWKKKEFCTKWLFICIEEKNQEILRVDKNRQVIWMGMKTPACILPVGKDARLIQVNRIHKRITIVASGLFPSSIFPIVSSSLHYNFSSSSSSQNLQVSWKFIKQKNKKKCGILFYLLWTMSGRPFVSFPGTI